MEVIEMTHEKKQMMVSFLTKEAIKTISEDTLKKEPWKTIKGKKSSNNKQNKSTRMEDAIWKAHRDVMDGARTGNLSKYSNFSTGKGWKKDGNNIIKDLTEICENAQEPIGTNYLLEKLEKYKEKVEFGALQKLINMTLKYFIILKCFEDAKVPDVKLEQCDCPLDRKILGELRYNLPEEKKKLVWDKKLLNWTEIKDTEYVAIQEAISDYFKNKNEQMPFGRLTFDFKFW